MRRQNSVTFQEFGALPRAAFGCLQSLLLACAHSVGVLCLSGRAVLFMWYFCALEATDVKEFAFSMYDLDGDGCLTMVRCFSGQTRPHSETLARQCAVRASVCVSAEGL